MPDDTRDATQKTLSDPDTWVERHGDALYRYALLRLRDSTVAEDLVQDTFLAVLRQRDGFAGRSDERTWMIGILKHKIIDHFRSAARELPLNGTDDPAGGSPTEFHQDGLLAGSWKSEARPADWCVDWSDTVECIEFRQILDRCLQALNPRQRTTFVLREMEELPSEEICNTLRISPTNLRVILHRVRLRLRACLERHWLGGRKGK